MDKTKELAVVEKTGLMNFTPEQIDVITRTIAPTLTKDEMHIFLHVCINSGLDPMAKQIYAIKRGGRMCIQTSIDGFRLIAERSLKYSPGKDTIFLYDDSKQLSGAQVFVKKMTPDGTWHDISATALLREYSTYQGLWKKMPSVMIEKCAESRALRRAFPADLCGLYSDDEMEQADAKNIIIPPDAPQKVESHQECTQEEYDSFIEEWSKTIEREKIELYISKRSAFEKIDPKQTVAILMTDQNKFEKEIQRWEPKD